MTLVDGAQSAPSGPPGAMFDTDSEPPARRRPTNGGSELSGHLLGEVGGVRTEVQVRPFQGFATGEVVPRDEMRWGSHGSPTKLLAKPPSWVPDETPCTVPPETVWTKDMREGHWDVRSDEEAAAICAGCPVLDRCLQDALDLEVDVDGNPLHFSGRFMVRGGMTPKGRWRLARGG